MSRANWLVLGLVLLFGGSVAVARDARVFPLSPIGGGGAGGSGGDVTLAGDNDFTGSNRFLIDAGVSSRMYFAQGGAPLYGDEYDAGIVLSDGGGLGQLRPGFFNVPAPVNGVPAIQAPGVLELGGGMATASNSACAVEAINYVQRSLSPDVCTFGVQSPGSGSFKGFRVMQDFSLYINGQINLESVSGRKINGPSGTYVEFQSNPASNGVGMYISAAGGGLASGGTMLALYNPGYSGSNVAQIEYDGALVSASARTKGTLTLSGGSATRTVISGSICVCSNTSALNAVQCNVAATTLTATGTGTDVIAYHCL